MLKNLSKNIIIGSLVFSFSFPATSLTLRLKGQRDLKNFDNSVLVAGKFLPEGTIVKIPDDYIDAHFKGDKKDEKAIIEWLTHAHSLPLRTFQRSGSVKTGKDFFVPIEVQGSKEEGWVTLRSLARDGGVELVTLEDTPIIDDVALRRFIAEDERTELLVSQLKFNEVTEDTYQCLTNQSYNERELWSSLSDDTFNIVNTMVDNITLKSQDDYDNRSSHTRIIDNFNRTCFPFSFNTFYQEAKELTRKADIPLDMFLATMTQESAGKCDTIHYEKNGTKSIGLFQINTGTAELKECGETINNAFDDECLDSPIGNLNEAIRVFRDKYKAVNGTMPESPAPKTFFGLKERQRDLWRKALSAYNGGEGHVFQGFKDIRTYNEQFNAQLDPDDWDIRRIFMLRKSIEHRGGNLLSDKTSYVYRRSTHNALSNLGYVESILSSESRASNKNHTTKWHEFILAN